MDRAKIIDRTQKLIRLSYQNPNINEGIAAKNKAQELITKYELTKSELFPDWARTQSINVQEEQEQTARQHQYEQETGKNAAATAEAINPTEKALREWLEMLGMLLLYCFIRCLFSPFGFLLLFHFIAH